MIKKKKDKNTDYLWWFFLIFQGKMIFDGLVKDMRSAFSPKICIWWSWVSILGWVWFYFFWWGGMIDRGRCMVLMMAIIMVMPLFSFAQSSQPSERPLAEWERWKQEWAWWTYCWMTEKYWLAPSRSMDPANNKRQMSYSLTWTIRRLKEQWLLTMQHSYRWMGERVQCMDYLWFNNKAFSSWYWDKITLNSNPKNNIWGLDYTRNNALRTEHVTRLTDQGIDINALAQWQNLFVANGEGQTEKQCYQTFVDYAKDPNNYQVENNPNMIQWLQIFDALKKKQDRYGIPVLPPNLTIEQFLNGNGAWFRWLTQVITSNQVKDFDETEIWYLQAAVNILGCDHIMMDGKLGNYTIKSMCRCAFPPQWCVELVEPTFGNLQAKNIADLWPATLAADLQPIKFSTICSEFQCLGTADPSKREIICTTKVELTMQNVPKPVWSQVEFCCPNGARSHEYEVYDATLGTNVNKQTCCIDPNKPEELNKCAEKDALIKAWSIACGIKTTTQDRCTLTSTQTWANWQRNPNPTQLPFCPCPNGWDRKLKEWSNGEGANQRTCPCIPYEPEKLREQCSNFNECKPWWVCKDKVTGVETRICPCPTGKWPVPWPNGNYICQCSASNEIAWQDWQCRACPEWLVPNKDKTRCECKDGCCGIKLNTNVPWIGRCIEFGNTNNLNDQWLNEYGDGNTIITVNILNAFPVLMTALGKILLTVILIFGFGLIVYAGIKWTTDWLDSWAANEAKNIIKKVAIGFAFLGASAIILHFINPNFFK